MKNWFAQQLLYWNSEQNTRQMPWKGEKSAYLVWLSEIILQQTRVEQGLPYFLKFKKKYPTVAHLARAPEDEVMKMWQGLGYYSRARNLHFTAKYITVDLKGNFPDNSNDLKKLKGVGDYTASAIASFVFGERKAVVDGNVIRVLSRVFGIDTSYDTTEGKKEFATRAQQLIDDEKPGEYNQAIMDFGAVICVPQNPKCDDCVFAKRCIAFNQQRIAQLPASTKKVEIKKRYFNYLLIKNNEEIFVQKREGNDIWKNLYQLPLIETENKPSKSFDQNTLQSFLGTSQFNKTEELSFEQMLTHRKIYFRFIELDVEGFKRLKMSNMQKVKIKSLKQLAFPRTIHLFLKQKALL